MLPVDSQIKSSYIIATTGIEAFVNFIGRKLSISFLSGMDRSSEHLDLNCSGSCAYQTQFRKSLMQRMCVTVSESSFGTSCGEVFA
jgi:hypothetical protein